MRDETQAKIIEDNPIGNGLDAFRASFRSICKGASISLIPNALEQLEREDLRNLTLPLLFVLQSHITSGLLLAKTGYGTLNDLLKLISAAASDDFDYNRVKPLLKSALASDPDTLIWNHAYNAITESTPPPRPIASSLQQTPWLRNTSSFANSSEHRKYVDDVLKEELGSLYVGLRNFHSAYFGGVAGLDTASQAFFEQCVQGSDPLFEDGWKGWPKDANQDDVLSWFADFSEKLAAFADGHKSIPTHQHRRRPLAKPNKPIDGSVGKRKMDVGFMNDPQAGKNSRCHWSQILVPGELKSNPSADKAEEAWLDLGRYAREVLAAQDTRRFVLGFTICGSLMRVWVFDRLGGIASEQFNINDDGLQFVSTILGFLWMNEEELGFDPTIMSANQERFIEVNRHGSTERIIIDQVMLSPRRTTKRTDSQAQLTPPRRNAQALVSINSSQPPATPAVFRGLAPVFQGLPRPLLGPSTPSAAEGALPIPPTLSPPRVVLGTPIPSDTATTAPIMLGTPVPQESFPATASLLPQGHRRGRYTRQGIVNRRPRPQLQERQFDQIVDPPLTGDPDLPALSEEDRALVREFYTALNDDKMHSCIRCRGHWFDMNKNIPGVCSRCISRDRERTADEPCSLPSQCW